MMQYTSQIRVSRGYCPVYLYFIASREWNTELDEFSKMQSIFLLQIFFVKMIHTVTTRAYATVVHVHVSWVGMENLIAQVCIISVKQIHCIATKFLAVKSFVT